MGNYVSPSSSSTNRPIVEHETSTSPNPRKLTTKIVSKDGYSTKVLFSTRVKTAPRHIPASTSSIVTTRNPTKKITRQSKIFVTSFTKANNGGLDDITATMSSGTILQKPTSAPVAMENAAVTVISTCLAGALFSLCLVILAGIILRKHKRGKTVRNGASKDDVLNTTSRSRPFSENKNTVVSVTSFCDSQEYTSIDEGCQKMHPTQTENLYDSVEVNSSESTPDTIFYKETSNGVDKGSCNDANRQPLTEDNRSPLYADDGLYLTPDVHEKNREQTDPEGRYSIIWPREEN